MEQLTAKNLEGRSTFLAWLSRLMASLLFGVTPTDPFTFGAVVAVLTAVAALAGYLPAARIEPRSALRAS
jgi:hypothetical protein